MSIHDSTNNNLRRRKYPPYRQRAVWMIFVRKKRTGVVRNAAAP